MKQRGIGEYAISLFGTGFRWTDALFKMAAVGSRFSEPAWEDG
jgi:hypothetical protein